MRPEDAGARTWLIAAFAGWAVLVWVLSMFGMGGSIDRLDDDPSLRRALPSPPPPGTERLGPLAQYADLSARPLFTDNRRPQPFVIDPMGEPGEVSNAFDFVLTSVLRAPGLQMVILQPGGGGEPVRVKQGEAPGTAPGWVLQSVEARRAVFAGPEGEQALELRVFDGVGGQAPTASATTSAAVPPAAAPAGEASAPVPAVAATPVADAPLASGGEEPAPQPPAQADAGEGPAGPLTPEAQQQAAQQQVEMIRKRIEERRARLRQQERAQATPRASENK